jgi:hypothetical protein
VVLEALASGLPVITTRFNGAGELITAGREGFVLESPAEVGSLADRMGYFFEASRIRPMGIQARSLAERFSWERNIEEMLRVLELARQNGKRGCKPRPQVLETHEGLVSRFKLDNASTRRLCNTGPAEPRHHFKSRRHPAPAAKVALWRRLPHFDVLSFNDACSNVEVAIMRHSPGGLYTISTQ